MPFVLSGTQVALVKRLIEFAEENGFFAFEFDDDDQEKTHGELWTTADRLYEQLSSLEKVSPEAAEPVGAVTLEQPITAENGDAWHLKCQIGR